MFDKYIYFILHQPLACTSVFITIIPIGVFLLKKAYRDQALRLLFFYLIIKFVIDLIMFHLACSRMNNLMLYNANVVLRYLLLSGMFFHYFESAHIKKIIPVATLLFTLIAIWDILQANPRLLDIKNHSLVFYSDTLESVLMILWILLYFYEILNSLKASNLLTFPFFWISSGWLVFYSTLVFIAPVLHYANQWKDRLQIGFLQQMPYLFETISMLFISIGVWFYKKPLNGKY